MSRKLLLHLGYPKAASTTMQNNVFLPLYHSDKINFLGRAYESKYSGIASKDEFKHWVDRVMSGDIDNACSYPALFPEMASDRINVFSENRFLIHYTLFGGEKIFANLKSYFEAYADTIDVVYIIRSQPAVIFSWYLQRYRRIAQKTFEEFLAYNHMTNWQDGTSMFQYDKTLHYMQKLFGENHVHVVFFEDLVHMPDAFASQWGALLGLNKEDVLPLLDTPSKNVTPRVMNRDEVKKYRPKKQPKRSMSERLLTRMGLREKSFVTLDPMTPDQEQQIIADFRESNIRLAQQMELDRNTLERYLYI